MIYSILVIFKKLMQSWLSNLLMILFIIMITTDYNQLQVPMFLVIRFQSILWADQLIAHWMPRYNFQKRMRFDKIQYDKWLGRGRLRLCNGNSINYGDVTAWFFKEASLLDVYVGLYEHFNKFKNAL